MIKTAVIDPTGQYRYSLTREWDPGKPKVVFIMLNGSTADAEHDDPTLRRGIGFANRWGFGSLEVVNLFGYRTTFPKELKAAADPYGPENNRYLWDAVTRACNVTRPDDKIIVAWGANGTYRGRDKEVLNLLAINNIKVYCLGVTKDGIPRHPLYLKNDVVPTIYTGEGREI